MNHLYAVGFAFVVSMGVLTACAGGGDAPASSASDVAAETDTAEDAAAQAASQVVDQAAALDRAAAAQAAAAAAAEDRDLPTCNAVLAAHYEVVTELHDVLGTVPLEHRPLGVTDVDGTAAVTDTTADQLLDGQLDRLLLLVEQLSAAPSPSDAEATVTACGLLGAHQAAELAWVTGEERAACNGWNDANSRPLEFTNAEVADLSPVVRRQLTAVRALIANRTARCG